jgi:hypothetical protein
MACSASATPLGFIKPEIPTLIAELPTGDGWIHEIKHDGYRTLIVIDQGKVRAFSRHGRDWTRPYRRVVQACTKLPCKAALIDGEIGVQDENGIYPTSMPCVRPLRPIRRSGPSPKPNPSRGDQQEYCSRGRPICVAIPSPEPFAHSRTASTVYLASIAVGERLCVEVVTLGLIVAPSFAPAARQFFPH